MIRTVLLGIALAGLAGAPAGAAPCRDAKNRFVRCPTPAAPARCKDARGKFTKCGAPGARPA